MALSGQNVGIIEEGKGIFGVFRHQRGGADDLVERSIVGCILKDAR
jgi:hypothetical protein